METKLTQKQKELIEKYGVFAERSGSSPAQARIMALLMVCDNAEMTFEEIYKTLKISKSAASNAINSLLLMERLDYHTKPGDRKRYFTSRIGKMDEDFEKSLSKLLNINSLLREILANRPKTNKDFNTSLQKAIRFLDFLEGELSDVYKKWRKQNK